MWSQTETERPAGYSISSDRGLLWQNRICVPRDERILKDIMTEAHDTSYTFHPRSTKMYQDLKRYVVRNEKGHSGFRKPLLDLAAGECPEAAASVMVLHFFTVRHHDLDTLTTSFKEN